MRTRATNFFLLFFLLNCVFGGRNHDLVLNVEIEALTPKGIQVTLPDSPGTTYFAFHANINDPITKSDPGTISGTVYETTEGKWVIRDLNVHLKPGDTVYYWVFVQTGRLGYRKDGRHTITGSFAEPESDTPTPCPPQYEASTLCKNMVVNLTERVFELQDSLALEQETNKILKELVKKDQKLSRTLVLEGLGVNDELVRIVGAIVRDKLDLSCGIKNVVLRDDDKVEFQVDNIDEKVQILQAAKTKLKYSRYVIT